MQQCIFKIINEIIHDRSKIQVSVTLIKLCFQNIIQMQTYLKNLKYATLPSACELKN